MLTVRILQTDRHIYTTLEGRLCFERTKSGNKKKHINLHQRKIILKKSKNLKSEVKIIFY